MLKDIHAQLLQAMPVGYALHRLILDAEGRPCDCEYMEVNRAFEEITGLPAARLIGKKTSELFPGIADDVSDIYLAYAEVAMTGISIQHEQNLNSLGKWYRVTAFSPKKGYFATLLDDLTAEKCSQNKLTESNQLLMDFLDSSTDMIYLKDNNLRHVYANTILAAFTGTTPDALVGKDDYDLFGREAGDVCRASDLKVLRSGQRSMSEEYLLGRFFDVAKFPVHYPDGTVGVGAYIKDITERKKQEDDLKRQIERQNILVDVFMRNFRDSQELLNYTLNRSLALTGSQYGYLFLYDEESREFTLNTWSDGVMDICEVLDKQTVFQLENTGIWGETVRQRKPIVVNDMRSPSPLRKGFPPGHVELENFMSVPITVDNKIVAVAGLGNKPTPYTDMDINELIILMQSSWLAVEKKTAQMQTLAEREKYQSILDDLPANICEFLPDCTLTFVNKEYCSLFGLPAEALINHKFLEFIPEKDRVSSEKNHCVLTPENRTHSYEVQVEKNGTTQWHRLRDIGIFDESGIPLRFCSIGFDITEQKTLSEERDRMLARMDAMFDGHEAIMMLVDPMTGEITDANPAASSFYGYTRDELLNLHIEDIDISSKEQIEDISLKMLFKVQQRFTLQHKLKDDTIKFVDVFSTPITFNDRTVNFSIIYDATEREKAYADILYISYHDFLTGAYNRRYFEEEFERLNTQKNFPITVVMGDVNGLKLINDSLGHHEGDALLKTATHKIEGCLEPGSILARIGGDEFGIILPKTDKQQAKELIQKIKDAIEQGNFESVKGRDLLSISFGFSVQTEARENLDKLMREAEGFMYNQKYYDSRSLKGRTIEIIMKTLFEKSPRDKLHSERVGNISAAIAEALGFDKERVNKIRVAGWLHDIGKIGIPENLLDKNGKLDPVEWAIMKTHPEKGWRILENTYEFSDISNIVLCHHESWDGSGYPKGLKGNAIPLESRIITVADAYDAMTFVRSYRDKVSPADAVKELVRCSGTQFDGAVVTAFTEQVLTEEKDFFSDDSDPNSYFK